MDELGGVWFAGGAVQCNAAKRETGGLEGTTAELGSVDAVDCGGTLLDGKRPKTAVGALEEKVDELGSVNADDCV